MPGVARSDGGVCGLHPHHNVGPARSSTLWMACTNCQMSTLIWEACYCLEKTQSLCPSCAPRVSCSHCRKILHLDVYHHCSSCIGNLNICSNCFTMGIRCADFGKNNRATSSSQGAEFALTTRNKGLDETLPELDGDRYFHFSQKPPNPNLSEDNPDSLESKNKDPDAAALDERLDGSIVTEKPNVSWDDVAGLQAAKDELQEAIVFPMRFPELFTGKRKPRQGILFYGPPGTGKSYLAKAVATEVDCTMFSISSSDIFSKWVGESEKLVKVLFEKARRHKPAIIFIDEVEALCGKRGSDSNEASDRVKTEFLVQMDGVGNNTSGITIIGATNLPWQLDTAILRRFQRRIHIGLPNHEARVKAFQIHTGDMTSNITTDEFKKLATLSDGFSGSDISNAVQDALMVPVRKIHSATHYRRVVTAASHSDASSSSIRKWTPCAPTHPRAQAMTWRDVSKGQLMEPPVEAADFYAVLENFKSSVSREDVERAVEWTEEYGIEGA